MAQPQGPVEWRHLAFRCPSYLTSCDGKILQFAPLTSISAIDKLFAVLFPKGSVGFREAERRIQENEDHEKSRRQNRRRPQGRLHEEVRRAEEGRQEAG